MATLQSKGLLWRAHLEAGASVGVYTVGLDTPLRLVINLHFCRCVWIDLEFFYAWLAFGVTDVASHASDCLKRKEV